jgi:hypothetical protein
MPFVSEKSIKNHRKLFANKVSKPETFSGLIFLLLSMKNRRLNGKYITADMAEFSSMVDDAFFKDGKYATYSHKEWFALLSDNWLEEVFSKYLKNQKLSATTVIASLFWNKEFKNTQVAIDWFKSKISSIVFDRLFSDDGNNNIHFETKACDRYSLIGVNCAGDDKTLKFDGTCIKKRASELNAAPFSQTLYAASEIKKIISVFDFDFLKEFNIENISSAESKALSTSPNIKQEFYEWLLKKGKADSTAKSYSGSAIKYCNEVLSKENILNIPLYECNANQVSEALIELQNVKEWMQRNEKGNSMYSSACKLLSEFLSKTDTQIGRTKLSKPFLLLAGISGTGKSRFVREQAELNQSDYDLFGGYQSNFELVSVSPDWHEPSDLLGYVLRLGDEPKLVTTPVIKFIVKAWLKILNNGSELWIDGDKVGIEADLNNLPIPFWLCLDEMNLAPVEQYFADYLSILETREWNDNTYTCYPLIKGDFFDGINTQAAKNALGLGEDDASRQLWDVIKECGLAIPFNLIVAGTVNMDETTHGFSRKVIDRALSLDFGEFFPNDFDTFFEPLIQPKKLTYPTLSQVSREQVGKNEYETVTFLKSVNSILKGTLFELAYRALSECLLAVAAEQPKDEKALQAVWDDFLMMKVLPRIEGDQDKLQSLTNPELSILDELNALLKNELKDIWDEEARPDLLREYKDKDGSDNVILISCRSRQKIDRMQHQLLNGYTTFWP